MGNPEISGFWWGLGQSLNRILSGRKHMIDRIDRKREVLVHVA